MWTHKEKIWMHEQIFRNIPWCFNPNNIAWCVFPLTGPHQKLSTDATENSRSLKLRNHNSPIFQSNNLIYNLKINPIILQKCPGARSRLESKKFKPSKCFRNGWFPSFWCSDSKWTIKSISEVHSRSASVQNKKMGKHYKLKQR